MSGRGGGSHGREFPLSYSMGSSPDWPYQAIGSDFLPPGASHYIPQNPIDVAIEDLVPYVPDVPCCQPPHQHENNVLFNSCQGVNDMFPIDQASFLVANGYPPPGAWMVNGGPTEQLPRDDPGPSEALVVPQIGPRPATIPQDHGEGPPGSGYQTASTPGLGGLSTCAPSPAVPSTPSWTPLPVQPLSVITKQKKRRKSSRAPKPTSTFSCPHSECDSTFTSGSAMTRHMKENHLQLVLFLCPEKKCPRSQNGFPRRHNLIVHISGKKHTRIYGRHSLEQE
ncbi:hypothetical protein HOY80DRAFT_215700 [Tuber brumale]|nr:hypothetical protein HOY80DRAFT_215700 [Tuber brumale]